MKIAFAKFSLNPVRPIKAEGYAQQTEPMFTVRDALEGRIFLMDQDGELFILTAVDLISGTRDIQHTAEDRLAAHFGKPVHLFLCGSHTHFGPYVGDEEYASLVADRLATAAEQAEFRDADLTVSITAEPWQGVGKSRISHWDTDQVLAHTLCFYDGEQRIAAFCIYNCHPTVLNGYTPFFTAEYPGVMRRTLEARHPGEFFAFLQGAAGDVSTRFTRSEQTEREMEAFGLRMADEIDRLLAHPVRATPVRLAAKDLLLPLRHSLKDPADLVIPDYIGQRERDTLVYGIENARRNLAHPENLKKDARVGALGFGDFSLVFSEFELFSEFNRAVDPATSALICYSQGYSAYIAGPSFHGMTYETLYDTLSDDCRAELMDTIRQCALDVLRPERS